MAPCQVSSCLFFLLSKCICFTTRWSLFASNTDANRPAPVTDSNNLLPVVLAVCRNVELSIKRICNSLIWSQYSESQYACNIWRLLIQPTALACGPVWVAATHLKIRCTAWLFDNRSNWIPRYSSRWAGKLYIFSGSYWLFTNQYFRYCLTDARHC